MVRRTSDFAIVAVAATVYLDERTGVIAAARVALAGVADRVVLADPELVDGSADETAARIAESLEPPATCTRPGRTGAAWPGCSPPARSARPAPAAARRRHMTQAPDHADRQ